MTLRRTPIKRSPVKRSRTPIKKKRAKPRRGPMRDPEYRAWCRWQMCVVLVKAATFYGCCDQLSLCDAAHTENNGMRSKGPDSSCVSLCRKHHVEYDRGRKAFEEKYEIDMRAAARASYDDYLDEQKTTPQA